MKSTTCIIMSTKKYLAEYQKAGQNPLGTHHLPPPKGGEDEYRRVPGYFLWIKLTPLWGAFYPSGVPLERWNPRLVSRR